MKGKSFEIQNNNIYFKFPYNKQIVHDIKDITGSRFNDTLKLWIIEPAEYNIEHIYAIIEKHQFSETGASSMKEAKQKAICSKERLEELRAICDKMNFAYTPRDYQLEYLAYAKDKGSPLNADDVGCGKSFESIIYTEVDKMFPVLVITPASVKYNWQKEWKKITGRLSVEVIESKETKKRKNNWEADVVIINYDILGKWDKEIEKIILKFPQLKDREWASIICDEAHFLKSSKSARSKAAKVIMKDIPVKQFLTGTAILNKPIELYNLLELLGTRKDISPSWKHYVETYCDAYIDNYGWNTSGSSNLIELNQVLRDTCYIRREKKDVIKEMPKVTRQIINVPITNKRDYESAKDNIIQYVYNATEGTNEEKFDKMLATSNAEHLVSISVLKKLSIEGKLKGIEQYLKDWAESGKKLLVFGLHREQLDYLAKKFKCPKIVGGISAKKKFNVVQDWQESDDIFLFANIASGGTGIDGLQNVCSNALYLELPWRPADLVQATGRLHRSGQTEPVTETFLLNEETIDMDIYDMLVRKEAVTEALNRGIDINTEEGSMKFLLEKMLH